MEPLLTVDDPDWVAYQEGDDAYYLRAAGEMVRRYCGWHIAPSITATYDKLRVGSAGLVMLPSLHVTDVSAVQVGDNLLDAGDYAWFEPGYVQIGIDTVWLGRGNGPGGGYSPDPMVGRLAGVPVGLGRLASVTMTHGFEILPAEVKQVIFELASAASEIPSGVATEIATPGFRLKLDQGAGGLSMNCGQRDRLNAFKLSWAR